MNALTCIPTELGSSDVVDDDGSAVHTSLDLEAGVGAKAWFVAWIDGNTDVRSVLKSAPAPDPDAAGALMTRLFPGRRFERTDDGDLLSSLNPDDGEVFVGVFPGLTIIAAPEIGIDVPSRLEPSWRPSGTRVVSFATHSVVDWFAFSVWESGALRRALSLSPDQGIIEDIGPWLPVEEPFWAGDNTDQDDEYPLPFEPLELAQVVHREFFGYVLEGAVQDDDPEPDLISLTGFRVSPSNASQRKLRPRTKSKPWWKFWQ